MKDNSSDPETENHPLPMIHQLSSIVGIYQQLFAGLEKHKDEQYQLRCGFGHFSFHLADGFIARNIVCCDYEYNGKQSGILLEIYVDPSDSKETPTVEVK
ncbi:hypothetical protein Pyn_09007 [Prunus yedoensis var. nudiflora]|uniref:Uncharacterized protein n=1 Tax=Prunus yedoensis var. nudiflora TaxID=2094558 RepID=A0A314V0G8_PRUYE|nr:hypothetical protein Pyn_09007 [Prunus yedoensis var. nudiflora]